MNYFQYKVKEPMGKIWALFQRLGKLSEEEIKGTRCEYLHTMEIIRSALAGNILLTDDAIRGFNLLAYENACKVNDKNNVRGNVSKELFIVDTSGAEDESEKVSFGDISERKLQRLSDEFEDVIDSRTFEQNLKWLLGVRNEYIVEYGVDVVSLLTGALDGITEAKETLVNFAKKNKVFLDVVSEICESGDHEVLLERLSLVI